MTAEQAIEFLVAQGVSPEEAATIVERTAKRDDGTIWATPEVLSAQAQALAEDPQYMDPEPETAASSQSSAAVERAEQERDQAGQIVLDEAAARTIGGQSLTPEQEEARDTAAATDWGAAIAAAQAANQEFNYDWVYNTLQLKPGSLDADEALLQVWESMVEIGALNDGEVAPADKVAQVKELLARSPQVWIVQQGVLDWAREADVYTPEQTTDGVSNTVIAGIMEKTGMSLSRAITVGRVAQQHDLDPVELSTLWENQESDFQGGSAAALERAVSEGGSVEGFKTRQPLIFTAAEYKAGLDLYNQSKVLAAVHVSDKELAQKLAENPYSLDSGEIQRALNYVGGPEGKEGDPQVSWLVNRLAGSYQVRAEVDDEAVRNAVQTLADSWNLTGSEGVAAALAGRLLSEAVARATAQLPNPFGAMKDPVSVDQTIQDTTAHVKAQLRHLPEYEALFGEMAPGEAEEEYVSRFENRSQQVLGDDVVSAVRAGMRSGNVNTIYQQGLLTDVGDSSTRFQEIMARNARIIREHL
jgi:hypothetical protein